MKFPIVFAHRGANNFAPENSLAAFQKAMQLGCDGIELDVRLCSSGEVVVFHDRHTYRMTDIRGQIHRLTLSILRKLELKIPGLPSERIPTLHEVLDLVKKNALINIDIKKESLVGNRLEEKIVKILKDFHLDDNVIISSFNPFVLKKISILNPKLHLGFIFRNRSSIMMLNGHPVKSLHARYRILSQRYLRSLNQRCKDIYSWTVDDENSMYQQILLGVDGIITNRPEVYLKLKEKLTYMRKALNFSLKSSPNYQSEVINP